MILAEQKTILSKSNYCIWCSKRFLPHGSKRDTTVEFGPVERSEEHIIPRNIFGNVVTYDVCKGCNERFGSLFDCELPRDQRVINAAKDPGVDLRELLQRHQGIQKSEDGREFPTTFQDGHYRTTPSLKDLDALYVGSENGQIAKTDLENLKRRLTEKLRRKSGCLGLSADQELRVDALINTLKSNPDQTIRDPILQEDFRPVLLRPSVTAQITGRPLYADLSIAKMLFEMYTALMPAPFAEFLKPVRDHLRWFNQNGFALKPGEDSICPLQSVSNGHPDLRHVIGITATQTSYQGEVRLFGAACWRFTCSFESNRPPPQEGFRIEITNPFGRRGAESSIQVVPL